MKDQLSVDRVNKLHPKVRNAFKMFIESAEGELGITLRVTHGLRTIQEQATLYAQGRTTPGKKLTNAKPGQSYHNYGMAVDLVRMDGNKADWTYDMVKLQPIAARYGITWGGTFKSLPDKPHFELTLGYHWRQLQDITKDKYGYPMV